MIFPYFCTPKNKHTGAKNGENEEDPGVKLGMNWVQKERKKFFKILIS